MGMNDSPCIIYHRTIKAGVDACVVNWHENLEIQFFVDGKGRVLLNGERLEVKKNDIAIINSNSLHCDDTDGFLDFYAIIIDNKLCSDSDIHCDSICFEQITDMENIRILLKNIINIYYSKECLYKKAKLKTAVLSLVIILSEAHSVSVSAFKAENDTHGAVKWAIEYINGHYAEKLTLDTIAKNAFINKYTLSKSFKLLTGRTVVEYINNFRCQRVKELIYEGIPISTAAFQCGFNNISFFTKVFKKYTGKLPSEYKKSVH